MIAAFCKKLGVHSENVARKASELVRLVEVKTTSGSSKLGWTSSGKVVICIEIAANSLKVPISKENILKLSGMKRSVYMNNYQIIERLLCLQTDFNVDVICVKIGCTQATDMARRILASYDETKEEKLDVNETAINAAAVYLACKSNNIRLQKRKLIDLCRISHIIFENATSALQQHIPKASGSTPMNHGIKRKAKTLLEAVDEKFKENIGNRATEKEDEDGDHCGAEKAAKMTDYDEWKRRILNS